MLSSERNKSSEKTLNDLIAGHHVFNPSLTSVDVEFPSKPTSNCAPSPELADLDQIIHQIHHGWPPELALIVKKKEVRKRLPPERLSQTSISTIDVVESLLRITEHQLLSDNTFLTYRKHFSHFARAFPELPEELDPLLEYLSQFKGETGRYKHDKQSRLKMLYDHAVNYFGLARNPLAGLPYPKVRKKPIQTLSLQEVVALDKTPETTTERAVWELLQGHGWRQIEVRRILGGDVRRARDNIILCRGKEREEGTPSLSETLSLLGELTPSSLPDDQPVLRSRRIRNGHTQPLGEDGMSQLIGRLFARVGIDLKGHDLRRTFASLVRKASGDEFLAMRLLRDIIPGYNDRYINFPLCDLVLALDRYSPLRLIGGGDGGYGGGDAYGGDGGESNSSVKQLLPRLLDQLEQLGETASEIKFQLAGNGHKAELLNKIKENLEHQVK